jgi:hypothetical protein
VAEHVRLQLTQLGTRLEAELVGKYPAGVLERPQGVGGATLAVAGRHQQRPPVLVERLVGDQRLEQRLRLVDASTRQLGLDPPAAGTGDKGSEACRRAPSALAVGDVGERRAADEPERRGQGRGGIGGATLVGGPPAGCRQTLELDIVDRVLRSGDEDVAAALGGDLDAGKGPAQLGHLRLQGVGAGHGVGPQQIVQRIGGDGVGRPGDEGGEQLSLLRALGGDVGAVVVHDGDGPEHVEAHRP